MRLRIPIALACLALAVTPAAAQYKYKDPNGRTVYSDQPPPVDAKAVQRKDFRTDAQTIDSSRMPYELRMAVQAAPVTLYTIPDCSSCDQGRQFLLSRGVPFVEKTVAPTAQDRDELARLGLGTNFPSLTIGASRLANFSANGWSQALDAASYPSTPAPPGSFTNPPPSPLVAPPPAAAAVPAPAVRPAPANAPDNPAGIRF